MANKFNINQLLSSASKQVEGKEVESNKPFKITSISVHDLVPSKDNFYSVENIEELKASIEMFRIKQNLVVKPIGDGKYKVIAGHRRRLAALALVSEGKKEFEFVPCIVEQTENELLEKLLLITTNATVRQLSDWEKVEQVKETKALLEEYKKDKKLPGRIRDLIAETLNTSATQVARMDTISNKLSEDFKEELKVGKLNISTAHEIAGLSEEEQREVFKEYEEKGSLSIKDVKQKKEDTYIKLKELNEEISNKLKDEHKKIEEDCKKLEEQSKIQSNIQEAYKETIHELKIIPEYFKAIKEGKKTFEYRFNDRGYKVGDILKLQEYDAEVYQYTGRSLDVEITYILEGTMQVMEGYAILSIKIK